MSSISKRQYYYKVTGCPADDSDDARCICWHDEGTGPYGEGGIFAHEEPRTWRAKPSEVAVDPKPPLLSEVAWVRLGNLTIRKACFAPLPKLGDYLSHQFTFKVVGVVHHLDEDPLLLTEVVDESLESRPSDSVTFLLMLYDDEDFALPEKYKMYKVPEPTILKGD